MQVRPRQLAMDSPKAIRLAPAVWIPIEQPGDVPAVFFERAPYATELPDVDADAIYLPPVDSTFGAINAVVDQLEPFALENDRKATQAASRLPFRAHSFLLYVSSISRLSQSA
jgi:hypothetical protein